MRLWFHRGMMLGLAVWLTACGSSGGGSGTSGSSTTLAPTIKCLENEHVENVFCVVNERSCVIPNSIKQGSEGFGLQLWGTTEWGPCLIQTCTPGNELVQNQCLTACASDHHRNLTTLQCDANEATCSITFGVGKKTWQADAQAYSSCSVVSCNVGYENFNNTQCLQKCATTQHRNPLTNNCDTNLLTCSMANGIGQQTWDPQTNQYQTCTPASCLNNFHIESNACLPNVKACEVLPPAAVSGTQTWNGTNYNVCIISACQSTNHLYQNSCDPDIIGCNIANGSGTQTWNFSTNLYNSCVVQSCLAGFHIEGNACLPDVKTCVPMPAFATSATQTWNGANYNNCVISACDNDHHLWQNNCDPNIIACTNEIANSTLAQQVWTGTAYTGCAPVTCASGFHIENNQCLPDIKACNPLPPNSVIATQTWQGSGYGACLIANCASNFQLYNNECFAEVAACPIDHGYGEQTWNGTSYNTCTALSCDNDYHLENNACISDYRPCPTAHGSAAEIWNGVSYGSCTVLACDNGYHIEANACVDDIQSCTIGNGTGLKFWQGNQYSFCTAQSCNPAFHLFENMCDPDVINCTASITHATDATRTWDPQAQVYAACVLHNCFSSYHPEFNVCADNVQACFDIDHAAAATKTWNGTDYNPCTASACLGGYQLISNACYPNCAGGTHRNFSTLNCDLDVIDCQYNSLANLITNGTFTNDTLNWLGNLGQWNNGRAEIFSSTDINGINYFKQVFATTTGHSYQVNYDLVALSGGGATLHAYAVNSGDDARSGQKLNIPVTQNAVANNLTYDFTAVSNSTDLIFMIPTHPFSAQIDNVIVREYQVGAATVATQTWNGSTYGNCQAQTCRDQYHLYANVCDPNAINCTDSVPEATFAAILWNSSLNTYNSCQAQSCITGYHVFNGACVQDCAPGQQIFYYTGSTQTFTVPVGCNRLVVDVYGGGGGGTTHVPDHGGFGGGGGGFARSQLNVNQQVNYSVTVGYGASVAFNGDTGGTSSFGGLLSASGGGGQQGGGWGGSGSGGNLLNYTGGYGASYANYSWGGGGGGAAGPNGNGGSGATAGPGGGGGGGYAGSGGGYNNYGSNYGGGGSGGAYIGNGGGGAPGIVIVNFSYAP